MLKTQVGKIPNAKNNINRLVERGIGKLARKNYYTARAYYHHKLARNERQYKEQPLLVYQMGKVGSLSITEALRAANIDRCVYHIHILRSERVAEYEKFRKKFFPDIEGGGLKYVWLCQYIHKRIRQGLNGKKWKIVTLVRDPVARGISDFFENSSVSISDSGQQHIVKSDWYGFETKINDLDISELFQIFLEKYDHDRDLKYFDLEFKGVLGIDLYATDFPKSKGYKIYREQEVDILLIKLENLNECATQAFKEYLDIDNFNLIKKNIGAHKDYADIYQVFRDNAFFSETYLDKVYSSQLVRHFYSESEIEKFRKKWSGVVR